jgi:hypothetical protein
MSNPSDRSRRDFLNLGAAAGASLLVDLSLSESASAASIPGGTEWAVRGKILQVPEPDHLEALPDALIVIGADGVISEVKKADEESAGRFRRAGRLLELVSSQYLLPGLIDTHIHAPQWPQMGTALDLPLEQWLIEYTFKLEARYSDAAGQRHDDGCLLRFHTFAGDQDLGRVVSPSGAACADRSRGDGRPEGMPGELPRQVRHDRHRGDASLHRLRQGDAGQRAATHRTGDHAALHSGLHG